MAQLMLQKAYRQLQKEPLEGFYFEPSETNIFDWKIYLEGPKETSFEGGIFELKMKFPSDYPMSPPSLHFVSEFWHPNVYKDGKVCISILHPPGDDPMSGERPEERWMPTQSVETIVLSVQSLLGDPNFSSPANVDASVEWRNKPDQYCKRIKKLIQKANATLPQHVQIAHPESNPKKKKTDPEDDLINDDMGGDYDFEINYDYGDDLIEEYSDDNLNSKDPDEVVDSDPESPKEVKNKKSSEKETPEKKNSETGVKTPEKSIKETPEKVEKIETIKKSSGTKKKKHGSKKSEKKESSSPKTEKMEKMEKTEKTEKMEKGEKVEKVEKTGRSVKCERPKKKSGDVDTKKKPKPSHKPKSGEKSPCKSGESKIKKTKEK